MTHTNHREGTPESLGQDFVVMFMPAKGYNNDAAVVGKLRRALDIYLRHRPVNAGAIKAGYLLADSPEQMKRIIAEDTPMIHAVYTTSAQVEAVLRDLKEADMGISVVVSGPVEEVARLSERAGIRRHSVEFSLGVLGRRDLLAPAHLRPLITMCGHGLISRSLAEEVLGDVRTGRSTPEEGARRLGLQCVCGIFNPERAARLIREAVAATAAAPASGDGEAR